MSINKEIEECEAKSYKLAIETSEAIEDAVKGLEDFRFGKYFYYSFKTIYLGLRGTINDCKYLVRRGDE